MFGKKEENDMNILISELRGRIEQLEEEKKELQEKVIRLQKGVDDSYRSYPKIDFLTKTYTSILADMKRQMDALILSVKFASENIVRSDIGMTDTDAVMAKAFSRVLKMPQQEIEAEIEDCILEDSATGTLTFYDADEFNSSREYGFRNNKLIRDIVLPDGIKKIKRGFFYGCTNLRKLHIPRSVEAIEDYAFFGCTSLTGVDFAPGSRVSRIGEYAFSSCRSLKEIDLPERLNDIGTAAFRECSSLSCVRCAEGGKHIERIGNHAFQNCSRLREFTLPPMASIVQTSLFNGCSCLENITVPAGTELVMDYVFKECRSLRKIDFASAATRISQYTLAGIPDETVIMAEGKVLDERPAPEGTVQLKEFVHSEEGRVG